MDEFDPRIDTHGRAIYDAAGANRPQRIGGWEKPS